MGVTISKLWGSNVKYVGDSTTGLTAEEKTILADTFSVLKQDLSKSGERLFIIYFTDYPNNMNYFRDFKDKSLEELKGTPSLIAHATNVMSSLNGMIAMLNDPANMAALIKKVGYNHGRRNLTDQTFAELKEAFVKFLQESLKNKLTPQVGETWSKAYDVIIAVFKQGMEEYKKDKAAQNQYFQNYPHNKNYFIDFRNRAITDLQGCPRLLFHASNVMNTLHSVMLCLNDPDNLVDLIHKVGYGHGKRGIKLQAFEDLKATFVLLLQEKMKSKYSPKVGEVWGKTFDVVIATFQVGVQQYIDEQENDDE